MRRRRQKVALIDSIREAIGDEAAVKLVKEYGGRKLYVPINSCEGHSIAQLIGVQPAAALSRRFGGERIDVPFRAMRRNDIFILAKAGVKSTEIARRLGCSRQWVDKVLNGADA
jgi:Mor family transcriptional regulator